MAGAAVLATGILAYTWRHLGENRTDEHLPRLEVFGPGNVITLQRGLALAIAGGFLLAPVPVGVLRWAPAILYSAAALADLADGFVARRTKLSTLLGARLDIELDGLGVLVAVALAIHLGHLPLWFLPVGLARPMFVLGLWWRKRRGCAVHALPPSRHRRLFAGIQMGFLSVALWPVLPREALTLVGACVLVPTLIGFARDWLVVSGRVDPSFGAYSRLDRLTGWLATTATPLAVRSLVPAAAAWLWMTDPLPGSAALFATTVIAAAAITLGFLGRLSAIMLLVPVGIHVVLEGLGPVNSILLAGAVGILMFGTGPLSFWKPEDRYLLARVGADS